MKRIFLVLFSMYVLGGLEVQAQSFKDLFNKDKITKTVSDLTGISAPLNVEGKWGYQGPAVEFKSDNLLNKAGGAVASSALEKKLDKQLSRIGFRKNRVEFDFHSDSTFVSKFAGRTLNGKYSINTETDESVLSYGDLVNFTAKVNQTPTLLSLLFDADKLLQFANYVAKQSTNQTVKSLSSIAESYDGMRMGIELKKK